MADKPRKVKAAAARDNGSDLFMVVQGLVEWMIAGHGDRVDIEIGPKTVARIRSQLTPDSVVTLTITEVKRK